MSQRDWAEIRFRLPPESYARLHKIKVAAEAIDNAEVFRNALQIYEWLIDQRSLGASFLIKTPESEPKEIVILP